MSVFGTRPEAIKMAPVVRSLRETPGIDSTVCVTGQHREMLDQVLTLFEIAPEHDLDLMHASQTLTHVTNGVLAGLAQVFESDRPDVVLVHGDTTTSMAAALAGFYAQVPVAHVEAGLRSGNLQSPWPEEMNRLVTSRVATHHYAPTTRAATNLIDEGIAPQHVHVTGNTVIDALHWVLDNHLQPGPNLDRCAKEFDFLSDEKPTILVTGHRRESFDGGLEDVCRALRTISEKRDVQIVYPVHRNPVVVQAAHSILGGADNVFLIDPLEYVPFIWIMSRASLIVTDSGGVQEEAPALNVPVLVTRDTTERPEAIDAGVVKLVGTDSQTIVSSTLQLLDDESAHAAMTSGGSPYGDGYAAERICRHLQDSYT